MVKKYTFGSPFYTGAVVEKISAQNSDIAFFVFDGKSFSYKMSKAACVYGLGEAVRGINKRGWIYNSYCTDDPFHTEDKSSLYGAHNFLIVDNGNERFGAFFDYPAKVSFDIGYSDCDILSVTPDSADLDVYIITADSNIEIVRQFRKLIGQSYIPPMWAFGYQQSRWGYFSKEDILKVADSYEKANIPLDAIYLDIDYMERFKDFTVNSERFPDFENFVSYMKKRGIRLVPIIDAAVKVEDGYDIYEQGKENGYFCKDENGDDYIVGVWPGRTVFPDFLNDEAREWFSSNYKRLTDMGIEGFWNDMNEPAIFYSDNGLKNAFTKIEQYKDKELDANTFFAARDVFNHVANSQDDYNAFYHNVNGTMVRHNDIHNLYGYNMTKGAQEAFEHICPDKRILLFSRASYIGMHRYGGIWTGDNHSWWSHILLCLRQLPSLNMCGFLYSGSDIGGFNGNCTGDLLLRWLSLGVFTPLMRNHSACGTTSQECYSFSYESKAYKNLIDFRYRLVFWLYSEYMKCVLNDDMLFRPLSFDYPDDEHAKCVDDQIMLGESLMIAPVYTQNSDGRYVYIPENMTQLRLCSDGRIAESKIEKGHHFLDVALDEIVFFIKDGYLLPLSESAKNTQELDISTLSFFGNGNFYDLYSDDGEAKNISADNIKRITK